MGRRKIYAMIASFVAVAAIALLLGFLVIPGTSPNTENAAVAANPDSQSSGITVHGHWTIEVFNVDGMLAERQEYENALVNDGQLVLSNVLGRIATVGKWQIKIEGSPSPCSQQGKSLPCVLCESDDPDTKYVQYIDTLVVKAVHGTPSSTISFKGYFTATVASDISFADTLLWVCNSDVSSDSCKYHEAGNYDFTHVDIVPRIHVDAGQIVQVTVEISFG